ncbi:KilA-N domain-containing protein [Bifidobacterium pseudolongum]|nr:KilA-N domain-containing protein [Bifidobacterium pseudolongum]
MKGWNMNAKPVDNSARIHAVDVDITIRAVRGSDYVSLTDMARHGGARPGEMIRRWLRLSDTIAFLTAWERISNPNFNLDAANQILAKSGRNIFNLSASDWISSTGAIGLEAQRGRSGGTYAHKDIAFSFASWISPEFHLFVIKDYQRLKDAEARRSGIEWRARRELVKTNYRLHTDAVRDNMESLGLPKWKERIQYASEADLINLAVFGQKASTWKSEHPGWKGNMRDYASVSELVILQNLEALNAMLLNQRVDKMERFKVLASEAERQRDVLQDDVPSINRLRAIIDSTEHIKSIGQLRSSETPDATTDTDN